MLIRLKLFAVARQRASGADVVEVQLPEGATVHDLRAALAAQHPALAALLAQVRFAINSDYASDATIIPSDAEVALIPPVSGG